MALLIDGRRGGGEPLPLPVGDLWRQRFAGYEKLSFYATAFRYSLSPSPQVGELKTLPNGLKTLHELAVAELLQP